MLKKEMGKGEIETFLNGKGDYVQIDHLSRLVKERDLALDKKKFAYQRLADLYEKKRMFVEAGKMYSNLGLLATTFVDKIKVYIREVEMYVKGSEMGMADIAIAKAIGEATEKERPKIYATIKEFYKTQALAAEKENRRATAIKVYEKLLQMKIIDSERAEVKAKLMSLYEKTGRMREYFAIKEGKVEGRKDELREKRERDRMERRPPVEHHSGYDIEKELGL